MHITCRLYKSIRMSLIVIIIVVCTACQNTQSSFGEEREDFYESVNKKWLNETTLPDGVASYTAFDEVVETTNQNIYELMNQIMEEPSKERLTQSERNLETLCMNFFNINMRNQQNIEPIKVALEEIRGIKNTKQLNKVLTHPDINCLARLVSFDLYIDSRNLVNVLNCYMPQLTLGDVSFYAEEQGIGTVIAHEISHCFDEVGAIHDKDGRYRDWWTTEDKNQFRKKLQQVKSLYNSIEIGPEEFLDGTRTVNENFADLMGDKELFRTFKIKKVC